MGRLNFSLPTTDVVQLVIGILFCQLEICWVVKKLNPARSSSSSDLFAAIQELSPRELLNRSDTRSYSRALPPVCEAAAAFQVAAK